VNAITRSRPSRKAQGGCQGHYNFTRKQPIGVFNNLNLLLTLAEIVSRFSAIGTQATQVPKLRLLDSCAFSTHSPPRTGLNVGIDDPKPMVTPMFVSGL
jgi:hypothetical protein